MTERESVRFPQGLLTISCIFLFQLQVFGWKKQNMAKYGKPDASHQSIQHSIYEKLSVYYFTAKHGCTYYLSLQRESSPLE